jgi:hypothetical protein
MSSMGIVPIYLVERSESAQAGCRRLPRLVISLRMVRDPYKSSQFIRPGSSI